MHRSALLLAFASAAACSEHSSPTAITNPPPVVVTSLNDTIAITVDPANVGPTIPSNFIGISTPPVFLTQTDFRRSKATTINVMKTLGTGVLRIGDSKIDDTWWTPGVRVPRSDSALVLTGAEFDSLRVVCKAANWTAIVGVNFAAALPDTFAAEAAFIQQHVGSLLTAVEFGNEPDTYAGPPGGSGGRRPPTYNFAAYTKELDAYLAAFQQRAPGVPIAAPATSYDTAWLRQTIAHAPSRFAIATQHLYSLDDDPGIPASNTRYPSASNLLSEALLKSDIAFDKAVVASGKPYGIPARLTEWNSGNLGGTPGVSSTFASALWAIDHTFGAAEAGLAGVNFHTGSSGGTIGYSLYHATLDGVLTPHAVLYGILAFQDAAKGQILNITTTSKRAWNLSAHGSVTSSDGTVRIALVNKDTATLSVRIVVPNATTVTVRRLAAGSTTAPLSDSTNVTYAGAVVTTSGTFTPATSESITPLANTFVVSMPLASAAVVVITTK